MPGGKNKPFIDWANTPMIEPEHPLSKPLGKGLGQPTLKKGEVPEKPSNEEVYRTVMSGMNRPGLRQATDQELFGHLVVPQEKLDKMEKDWENVINDWHKRVASPVEKQDLSKSWGRGPISKETLSEEEERIRKIPVDPRLLEND